jgi:hypothetical protein
VFGKTVQRTFETGREGAASRRNLYNEELRCLLNSCDEIEDKKGKMCNTHREV